MSQRTIAKLCKITLLSCVGAGSWKGRWISEVEVLSGRIWCLMPT